MLLRKLLAPAMVLSLFVFSCGGGSSQPQEGSDNTGSGVDSTGSSVSADQSIQSTLPEDTAQSGTQTAAEAAAGPSGTWSTTMGELDITVKDSGQISGQYPLGTIEGTLDGTTLEFSYSEGDLSGTGSFQFSDDFSSFTGVQNISGTDVVWDGSRI